MFNIVVNGEVVGNGNSMVSNTNIFMNNQSITSLDCNHIPFQNNNMELSFKDCSNLVSITNINDSVTNMGGTFTNCPVLNSIDKLPDNLTSISYEISEITTLYCYKFPYFNEEEPESGDNAVIYDYGPDFNEYFLDRIYSSDEIINENSIIYLKHPVTNEMLAFDKNTAGVDDFEIEEEFIYFSAESSDWAAGATGEIVRSPNDDIEQTLINTFPIFSKTPNLKIIPTIPNGVSDDKTLRSMFKNNNYITTILGLSSSCSNISGFFENCSNLVNVLNIPNGVTTMHKTFHECSNLVNAPAIPETVINMSETFMNCPKLVNAPVIPNSVTDMSYSFYDCESLVNAPVIPNSVTNMSDAFLWCTRLINVPTIPDSVVDMSYSFASCHNLTTIPSIPNNVANLDYAFAFSNRLTKAPDMNNATNINSIAYAFKNCTNLTGNIYIGSKNITNATNCFANTSLNKEVYITKDVDGVNTSTYNSFIAAGYSTTTRKDGVLLKDINDRGHENISVGDRPDEPEEED